MGITLGPGMSALKRLRRLGNGDVGVNNGRMPRWLRHVTRNTDRVAEEEFRSRDDLRKSCTQFSQKTLLSGLFRASVTEPRSREPAARPGPINILIVEREVPPVPPAPAPPWSGFHGLRQVHFRSRQWSSHSFSVLALGPLIQTASQKKITLQNFVPAKEFGNRRLT